MRSCVENLRIPKIRSRVCYTGNRQQAGDSRQQAADRTKEAADSRQNKAGGRDDYDVLDAHHLSLVCRPAIDVLLHGGCMV
jgi:hypothetical protein